MSVSDNDSGFGSSDTNDDDEKKDSSTFQTKSSFLSLSPSQLRDEMNLKIENLSQTLSLNNTLSSMILRLNSWNTEKILSLYFEDSESFLKKLHLDHFNSEILINQSPTQNQCAICMENRENSNFYSLGCEHWFCQSCWTSFCKTRLKHEGQMSIQSTCPASKCHYLIADSVFKKFLNQNEHSRYQDFLLNSFVQYSRHIRWCRGPNCNYALINYSNHPSNSICWNCSEEAHQPATCIQIQEWNKKCLTDSHNATWISENTKQCPRPQCKVRIEKNHGCMHMVCPNCNHDFCWICLGPWSEHGFNKVYSCNKYSRKIKTNEEDLLKKNASTSSEALDIFLHFYQRYHHNMQSKQYAILHRPSIQEKMTSLHASHQNTHWIEVQFLADAVEQVIECRKILAYTYVYAFYLRANMSNIGDHSVISDNISMNNSPPLELFEFMQQDLEKNTEFLNELIEQPFENIDRHEVVNFSRITQQFAKQLLEAVS